MRKPSDIVECRLLHGKNEELIVADEAVQGCVLLSAALVLLCLHGMHILGLLEAESSCITWSPRAD